MKPFRPGVIWLVVAGLVGLGLVLWHSRPRPPSGLQPEVQRPAEAQPVVAQVPAQGMRAEPGAPRPQPAAAPLAMAHSQSALAEAPAVCRAFLDWAEQYRAAAPVVRAALLAEGEALAAARREELLRLIQENPEQALAVALPYRLRKHLPPQLLGLIEQPVSGRGQFRVVESLALTDRGHELHWQVILSNTVYRAYTYGARALQRSRRHVPLHGIALTNAAGVHFLALAGDTLRLLEPEEVQDLVVAGRVALVDRCPVCNSPVLLGAAGAGEVTVAELGGSYLAFDQPRHAQVYNDQLNQAFAASWPLPSWTGSAWQPGTVREPGVLFPEVPPGEHLGGRKGIMRLLYMPAVFADDPMPPQSQDAAQATCANNARIYKENSYGAVDWISDVTPLLRLPQRKAAYADGIAGTTPVSVLFDALAIAASLGYVGPYDDAYVLFNTLRPVVSFGGRSDGLLNGSPGALAHELGHSSFGWIHANYMDTSGTNPGPPDNRYPTDPDSAIGHDDVNAPILLPIRRPQMVVYGDPYDIMGSGAGHFNVIFKNAVNWLTDEYIRFVNSSQTNRIYAFDVPRIFKGRHYALRIRKDWDREYWVSHRQGYPDNPWLSHGVILQWKSAGAGGNTLLIDTTYATYNRKNDCAVVIGRTFADPPAHIYITPIAEGGDSPTNKWIDVVVNLGPFPNNQPPTLSLSASAVQVEPGQPVVFTATAQDPNGDVLAYHWEFGDYTFGPNAPVVTNAWATAGQYVVRCEASDMKGGRASAFVVVIVGQPTTHMISGRVVDWLGNPLEGVRVHNGAPLPANPPIPQEGAEETQPPIAPTTHRYTYTDSQGRYTIGNIPPGTYNCRAFLYGYKIEPLFPDPVDITSADAAGLDFVATPLTRVWVETLSDAPEIGQPSEGVTNAGWFRICREGDLSQDLLVRYRVDGTAVIGTDYLMWDGNWWTNIIVRDGRTNIVITQSAIGRVTIPAGQPCVDMPVVAIPNEVGDGGKSVIFTLLLQTNDIRITSYLTNILITNYVTSNAYYIITNTEIHYRTNLVSIPGWELLPWGPTNALTWFQTYPTYVISSAEARLWILDDDPPNKPTVSVQAIGDVASEVYNGPGMFMFTRNNAPVTNDLVIHFTVSGTASNGLDYILPPSPITIRAGESFALLPLEALNDQFVEGPETVTVTIEPSDAYEGGGSATVTIIDDNLPRVTIYASDSVAGKTGPNLGRVTVARTGDLSEPLLVNYLVSGTAVSGRDFQPLSQQVIIPAGSRTADIVIVPIDNPIPGARTVVIQLADSPAYNIEYQNTAAVTIQDSLPTVTLTAGDNATEGGTTTFTVTRTEPTNTSLVVYFTVGGTAVQGSDYAAVGTNVVIPAGAFTATIQVSARGVNDDVWREYGDRFGDETVIVQLLPGPDYNLGSPSGATVRIGDNDEGRWPQVGFMLRESVAREGDLVLVLVKCSANPERDRPINFDFRVVGGTAVEGVNYFVERWMFTNSLLVAWGPNGIETNSVPLYWVGRFYHYDPPDPPREFLNPEDLIGFIPVLLLDDGVAAGNKTLTLRLLPPSGYETNFPIVTNVTAGVTNVYTNIIVTHLVTNAYFGDYLTHTITIIDVGVTTVSARADPATAFEAQTRPGAFIISRDGPLDNPLTVSFAVAGDAAPGNDYVAFSPTGRVGTVTIPAGTNQVVLPVVPIDDPEEELPEVVVLELIEQPGYSVQSGSAAVTIVSDDGTIQFDRPVFRVSEGQGPAVITVVRTGDSNRLVSVDFAVEDGTARAPADYLPVRGTLQFLPGETVKTFEVPLVNDSQVEPDETVLLHLLNPSGGVPLGGQRDATLVIANDDTALVFATNSFTADENGRQAQIVVARLGLTNQAVSVTLATTDGTATNGLDYRGLTNTVTLAAGQTLAVAQVPIVDDELFEGDETVLLALRDPSPGVSLGAVSNATLVILDDECTITLATNNFLAWEYARFAQVTVWRTGGAVNPVRVDYFTTDGYASNRLDYEAVGGTLLFRGNEWVVSTAGSGVLEFRPGDTNLTILVPLLDDQEGEGNEHFYLTLTRLQGPTNALPGATRWGPITNATVTILDNEMPGNVDYEYRDPNVARPGADGPVYCLALQADLGVVFGGEFTNVNGFLYNNISRLTSVGVVDPFFNPGFGANGPVYALAVTPDNRIVAGGAFSRMNNVPRFGLARLNADGALDLSFDPGLGASNGVVRAVAVQADGRVVVGGAFGRFGNQVRENLARVHTNGVLDTAFNPAANGPVFALAVQPDGRILVGGAFTRVNGASYPYLARLLTNGLTDTSFSPAANLTGPVYALGVQPDGRIVVGGAFTAAANTLRNLIRLNPDGTLDTTFQPGAGPDGAVYGLAIQGNGRIIIGGGFASYNGTPRSGFARLLPNGSLDFVFNVGAGANAPVRAVVVQPDTAVLIGGEFTEVNELPRHRIARIHGDEKSNLIGVEFAAGSFRVRESAGPARITVVRSGNTNAAFSIDFATQDGTATHGLDYLGSTNTLQFAPGQLSLELSIPVLDDTLVEGNETVLLRLFNAPRLVELGGWATATLIIEDDEKSVRFSRRKYTVRENATNAVIEVLREGDLTGTVSVRFNTEDGNATAGLDYGAVNTRLVFAQGETNKIILIPIEYDDLPEIMETATLRLSEPEGCYLAEPWLAKLMIEDAVVGIGAPDPTFDPEAGASAMVRALTLLPEAKLLVGGAFTSFAQSSLNYLAQLTVDGGLDPGFNPGTGPNGLVSALGTAPDGSAIAAGTFTQFNGLAANRVVRLNPDGSVQSLFAAPNRLNAGVVALAVQPDGRVVVVGNFTEPTRAVARLRVDGGPDVEFYPGSGPDGPVHAVCVVTNGTNRLAPPVVIGGAFNTVNGFERRRVARLLPNGEVDLSFQPALIGSGVVYAVAADAEGRVLVGGSFTNVAGQLRAGIARLTWDGALDPTFDPGQGANGTVWAIAVQPNGKVLIGGEFTQVGGLPRQRIARLLPNGAVDLEFDTANGADGTVYAILVLPDNKVVIGGSFSAVGGVPSPGVARLMGDPPPPLRIVASGFGGAFGFGYWAVTIDSRPGSTYVLEASSDLTSWVPVAQQVATDYRLTLVDPGAAGLRWRFYRVGRLVQ